MAESHLIDGLLARYGLHDDDRGPMAALLNRPAFGPFMQLLGANRAYEPAALAVIAFAITWGCMALIQIVSRFAPRAPAQPH